MPLSLQMLITNQLLDELANCFITKADADLLLVLIKFPVAYRPNFVQASNPMEFWLDVCEQIEKGRVQGGFEPLLEAAANRLPGNPVFAPFARTTSHATVSPAPVQTQGGSQLYPQSVVDNFDAFSSYSSRDRDLVRGIVNALRARDIKPWMDEWDLQLGKPFAPAIEQVLSSIGVMVVFFGTGGLGPWQKAEVEAAYDRAFRDQCLLIPVMLPGVAAGDLPPFLRRLNGIHIRNGQDDTAIDRLVSAIRRHSH